ncbi:methylenetetrahydrofolate reductase [Brevibacterium sp.]|uniref:methylenetetrahydrofolate reductase n=1 Tax=Brevibacterium sp. TaxID=1701 RepID=UPI0028123BE6|nr:methylenetetrahydrofolate reductase [Brevibacterium sp.]
MSTTTVPRKAAVPKNAASPRISASAPASASDSPGSAAESAAPRHRLRRALSFEVIPPRSEAQAARMPEFLANLDSLGPDYLAVTSSANSRWLHGTAELIRFIAEHTSLKPLAHLACTAGTEAELISWIDHLLGVGVRGFLAIRGDFPDGTTRAPAGHLAHADELVSLLRRIESDNVARLAAGRLGIGVAAYPSGHPESAGPHEDLDVLAAKQRNGADFAITQLFFDPAAYARLRLRAEHAGIRIPIIPGILPITSLKRLHTMGRLSGLPVPDGLLRRFDGVSSEESIRRVGLEITAEHTAAILDSGADGLHFYTFNDQATTFDLLAALDTAGVTLSSLQPRPR